MRYFIQLSYRGTHYYGWQIQPTHNSIQAELQKALNIITGESIDIVGAGRTDTGVHAKQMFAHFDLDRELDSEFTYKLNSVLPNDIVVYRIKEVSENAHARFDASSRTYQYHIYLGRDPFNLETSWQLYRQKLNVEKMNQAAEVLLEYKDFKAFSKVKTDVKTFECSISEAKWHQDGAELIFSISANRFLRNMVRAIVGTLVEVGIGKRDVEGFRKVIESRNRTEAGLSVPAQGLFLTKIDYPYTSQLEEK